MVNVNRFEEIRIVQDKSIDTDDTLPRDQQGTKVITDVLTASEDSLFPLQGALGYEIHQSLFIGPNCLVVEGVSDLLYLQVMSAILEKKGRTGLDGRWTLTPTGGSDKVSTFVALIGAKTNLNIAVLVDYQKKDRQVIENLYKSKLLSKNKVRTFADFTKFPEADVEDMFDRDLYLELVNKEFSSSLNHPIKKSDLISHSTRILVGLDHYFKEQGILIGNSKHYRVARLFASESTEYESKISKECLDRFEYCFKEINALL